MESLHSGEMIHLFRFPQWSLLGICFNIERIVLTPGRDRLQEGLLDLELVESGAESNSGLVRNFLKELFKD